MNKLIFLLLILALATTLKAQDQDKQTRFPVKYLSAEYVYLDGGKATGLNPGDQLAVVRGKDRVIAKIEVVFAADFSASCKVIFSREDIKPGDTALLIEQKTETPAEQPAPEEIEEETPAPEAPAPREAPARKSRKSPRISGSASLQYYHLNDLTGAGLDFSQPTFRINFRARDLWGKDYQFRLRTRTRYNQRTRSLGAAAPRDEWRNRIYELSFTYENDDARFNYQFGRIFSRYMSGVGYIDGVQLQHNFSPVFRMGILGGTQPDWRDSNFQTKYRKYGLYLNYRKGDYQTRRFESTLAAAAQYYTSTVSREFLYLQNNYSFGTRFNLYQSAEMDINRGWRKEKSGGRGMVLSNLFISGRYQVSRPLTVGLTFDNRQNYWTYEIQSMADSLFDDALRTGLRANVSLRLPGNTNLYANSGFRKRESDKEATYSYSGGLNKSNFLIRRMALNVSYAGFSNLFTDGHNTTLRLSQGFLPGHRLEVAYGQYAYRIDRIDESRNNQWVRANTYLALLRHWFFSGMYEYGWGEDLEGTRMYLELGYRF